MNQGFSLITQILRLKKKKKAFLICTKVCFPSFPPLTPVLPSEVLTMFRARNYANTNRDSVWFLPSKDSQSTM